MADATRSLKIVVEEEKKGDGYNQAANDIDQYGRKVSEADLKTKQWAEDSQRLQTEISKSKDKIKELHQEVAKTGDTSLFGDLRKEEAKLRGFESTLTALAPAAGKSFFSLFSESFSGAMPSLMPVVIGTVAGLAPLLGAMVAGAVTGVAGGLGVAGGIFAASKDPQVKLAATELGKHISTSFFSSGASFVEPIKQSVTILEKAFDGLHLEETFKLAAPFVTEFASGLAGMATQFMPGFNKALVDGKPAIDLFAQELPMIGQALGDLFAQLADSKGTISGVNALFALTVGLVHDLGTAVTWLGDRYVDFNNIAANVIDFQSKIDDFFGHPGLAQSGRDQAAAFRAIGDGAQYAAIHFNDSAGAAMYQQAMNKKLAPSIEDVRKAIEDENTAISDYLKLSLTLDEANIRVAQGFADLHKNLVKGKQNWDLNTQAGRDNRLAIDQQIDALDRQRLEAIKKADGDAKASAIANQAYDAQIKKLAALAEQEGMTQAAAEALAQTYDIEFRIAVDDANLLKQLGPSAGVFAGITKAIAGSIPKKAGGGNVMAGRSVIVGDGGRPELFTPSSNGYISPSVPTGSGGGGMNLTLNLGGAPTGALDGMFVQWLMQALTAAIRAQGGQLSVLGLKPA